MTSTTTYSTHQSCAQHSSHRIGCYVNRTAQFQIIRIVNTSTMFASASIERTVLPYTQVFFEASTSDQLQVHGGNPVTSILSDTISCAQLIHSQ